ncbi:bifunctional 2',3'-cyclic-nucleotide 2'-phosphodiesterase/3'-nucleotidase [Gemmobacter serpentinus]|uniref:bifunctional 2',3'-cyclic-nucleotide 2'-phosphodiesterase/3'-nucleotidase n=1 Tax=Gemmobacter serpentinus TaxID=2652247 RepID=UPI00124C3E18|nr:bifunctional 2',3'-cyclic-nucleotide 2'-phosphodiesterase/3'-nucleotidase [Gemmobacter serpentinus]
MSVPVSRSSGPDMVLRILATTDLHVHLMGYDYYADREDARLGLARTATLIAAARTEVADCLLVDNGDFLQGNPMGDFIALRRSGQHDSGPEGLPPVHPAIRVMNRLGYDAATLGNHEFNYGLETLSLLLRGANFPIVSANIAHALGGRPREDRTYMPPFALLDRQVTTADGQCLTLRIGVIGFAPPQIVQWDRLLLEGVLSTRDIVAAARDWVPELRAAGADVVIALSHSGIGNADDLDGAENASAALTQVPGIDAIIAGHSHLVYPSQDFAAFPGADLTHGRILGRPIVMPGAYGSHLGVIDLHLAHDSAGWRVTSSHAEVRAVRADTSPLPEVVQEVRQEHAQTLHFCGRSVGQSQARLHSHFATIAASNALDVVAEAQRRFVARQVQGRPEAGLPILSAVSPFKAGGRGGAGHYIDIPAGDLAMRHIADLYIFPNTIIALRLTGAELADWLEASVGLYRQIRPGSHDQMLLDEDFPSYNHDRISGLSFEIDLSQPARFDRHGQLRHPQSRRLRNLRHGDAPVDPAQHFILATNSYRAAGSGGYAGPWLARSLDLGRVPIRDILMRHVAETSPLCGTPTPGPRFCPMPGTSVLFDTAPGALETRQDIAHLQPEFLGHQPSGFARFRLHL